MRKVESRTINYIGYNKPETLDELEMEILGLETAIATANQRIAVLRQSIKLNDIVSKSTIDEDDADEKTVAETPIDKETK
jgi:hypothetical protein